MGIPTPVYPELTEAQFREYTEEAAYFRWLNEGEHVPGDAIGDWVAAEAEIIARFGFPGFDKRA